MPTPFLLSRAAVLAGLIAAGSALAAAPSSPARAPAAATPPSPEGAAAQLRERVLGGGSRAWEILESLTTDIGARPVGSAAMDRAHNWALDRLTALGFQNVHAEAFTKEDAWFRGNESAAIVAPVERPLSILGLGGSVPTPAGGVEGEVVVFATLEALAAAPAESLAGRIAVVNQPMTRTQDGEGYAAAVRVRAGGASIAAGRGAIAFLTRSITTGTQRAPHTGALRYDAALPRIPAAALGVADADLLSRLAARGAAPRVRLVLESTTRSVPAWNVVGEIPGREPAAGTIVIGGHLDSWDPGQGAVDDGAGVAITMAAARLIGELPVHPRRTIRFVAWGSEETGGAGDAYAKAHAEEAAQLVVAAECDSGAGQAYRLSLPKLAAEDPLRRQLAVALAPLRVFVDARLAAHGGSDVEGLQAAGVPVFELTQDSSGYFDIHHSADDTLDKVSRTDLDQNVAVWAVTLELLGESSSALR
jgi:hypothetical protein